MTIEETTQKIINACKDKGYEPNEFDEETIGFWCNFYEVEPMALAERLAEELDVLTCDEIFALI